MRRFIRDISSVLIIAGALLLIDAAVTLAWQEPLTAVIGKVKQSNINRQFLSFTTTPLSPLDTRALVNVKSEKKRISYLARREERQVPIGDAMGRIVMSKIGASFDIVQGTDAASLEKGPGHYPETSLPGLGQTVAIAGHRTTYLAPFRRIDALKPGDQIDVKMPYANFTYTVQYHKIVLPTALWVIKNVGYDRLVLSACNPLYSAAQRIIVFAKMTHFQPLGAARAKA